ncbi:MAG: diaminopimelate decarboxylase [Christensenellales bacterium]
MMQGFTVNQKGNLQIGGCDAVELAMQYGTPLYVMDENKIRSMCRAFREALGPDGLALYAGKAFANIAMFQLIDQEGLGLDVVSDGELYTAMKAGFPGSRIYMHGNNKTETEIRMAVKYGVDRIVADYKEEIVLIDRIAKEENMVADISLRVRPGIEAHTHDYILTGKEDSKFGIGRHELTEVVRKIKELPNIRLKGMHCHIGSQIFELEPFAEAAAVLTGLMLQIKTEVQLELEDVDFGGGFGIVYTSADHPLLPGEYVQAMRDALQKACLEKGLKMPKLVIEPGRSIVGEAGVTLYHVGAIKDIPNVRRYISVDGGMADNPRQALYQAKYSAVIANKAVQPAGEVVSVAGKCCESGDMLIWDAKLQSPAAGDILAVFSTGAYNYSMASNYNRLRVPAVVFVKEGKSRVVVRRQSYEDLVRNDCNLE